MILVCGIPSESPVKLLIQAAKRSDVPIVVFNQRQAIGAQIEFRWSARPSFEISGSLFFQDTPIQLDRISGIFNRMMDYQLLPEYQSPETTSEQKQAIASFHLGFNEWLELTDARVMNRASAMASNLSKPYQSRIIQSCGFFIPPTLITNDPQLAADFIDLHGNVVYKSISAVRSIVRAMPGIAQAIKVSSKDTGLVGTGARIASDIRPTRWYHPELEKIRNLPTQFQAFIPGENVRVHVVGEQRCSLPSVIATRILSQAVDYRYASREGLDVEMEPIDLDTRIEHACRRLARTLNLPLCGIDLKKTPEGEWYCFEVNPMPAFSYYQEHTGQPIAERLLDALQ